MHAAVVTSFDTAPQYLEMPTPVPRAGEELVSVLASALHPRVRSQADGSHYSSTQELPLVPGIDGVGRTHNGELRYFILPDTVVGAMAEQTVIGSDRSIELPDDVDVALVAAAMNPAMSSWIALRRRIDFRPGSRVLVMGATGNAGRMAVQISRRLGASHVAAAGRHPVVLAKLPTLGADSVIDLGRDEETVAENLGAIGAEVDVVIDYLWGDWVAAALHAIVPSRADDSRELTWLQVGSVAGRNAPIPSAALRACNLRLLGSGQGAVPTRDILAELPALVAEVTNGDYALAVRTVPLADVAIAWDQMPQTDERLVVTPGGARSDPTTS